MMCCRLCSKQWKSKIERIGGENCLDSDLRMRNVTPMKDETT